MPQWPWNSKRAVTPRLKESPISQAITEYLNAAEPEEWGRIAEASSTTALSADVLAEVRRRAREQHTAGNIIDSGRLERLAFFLQAAQDDGIAAGVTAVRQHAEEISQILAKYLDAWDAGLVRSILEKYRELLTTDEGIGDCMTMVETIEARRVFFVSGGSRRYLWTYPHRVQLLRTLQTHPLDRTLAKYAAAETKAVKGLDGPPVAILTAITSDMKRLLRWPWW